MQIIQPSTNDPLAPMAPGVWRRRLAYGQMTAIVTCPICGLPWFLDDHRIDAGGSVSPRVRCGGCALEDLVKLIGWPNASASTD